MENLIDLKVRISRGKCRVCGANREIYYLSDNSYGERLLLTTDGKYYGYVDLFKDEVYDEVESIIKEIYSIKNKKLSLKENANYLNITFGVTCDVINRKTVDASKQTKSCIQCGSNDLVFESAANEYIKQISIPLITHFRWNKLGKEDKKTMINNKLQITGTL